MNFKMNYWMSCLVLLLTCNITFAQEIAEDSISFLLHRLRTAEGLSEAGYGSLYNMGADDMGLKTVGDMSTSVSYYTGVPNISIPIYNIENNNHTLPIYLSYHNAGIKVSQEATRVGLGWRLFAGGCISRVVRDKDDFKYPTINYRNLGLSLLDSIVYKNFDYEPDIFQYQFGDQTGKFFFDRHKENNVTNQHIERFVSFTPENNLKISYNATSESFQIVTAENIKYIFAAQEIRQRHQVKGEDGGRVIVSDGDTLSNPETSPLLSSYKNVDFMPTFKENSSTIVAWHLTSIVFPEGDTITLSYDILSNSYLSPIFVERYETKVMLAQVYSNTLDESISDYFPKSRERLTIENVKQQPVLKTITWKNGKIVFTPLASKRLDVRPYFASPDGYTYDHPLAYISIYDKAERLIRSYRLHHSYFKGRNRLWQVGAIPDSISYLCRRLKLDSVSVIGGEKQMRYRMTYNMNDALPMKNMLYKDKYGYYAGIPSGAIDVCPFDSYRPNVDIHKLHPQNANTYIDYPSLSVSDSIVLYKDSIYAPEALFPKPNGKASVWLLKNFSTPTGGTTTFSYQCNKDSITSQLAYSGQDYTITYVKPAGVSEADTIITLPFVKSYAEISLVYQHTTDQIYPNNEVHYLIPPYTTINYPEEEYGRLLLWLKGEHTHPYASIYADLLNSPVEIQGINTSYRMHTSAFIHSNPIHLHLKSQVPSAKLIVTIHFKGFEAHANVGGMRVSKVATPIATTNYKYLLRSGQSSGITTRNSAFSIYQQRPINVSKTIGGQIKHLYGMLYCLDYYSFPLQSIENPFTGYGFGYSRVLTVQSNDTETIKDEYEFYNDREATLPNIENYQSLNGRIKKIVAYANNLPAKEESYEYYADYHPDSLRALRRLQTTFAPLKKHKIKEYGTGNQQTNSRSTAEVFTYASSHFQISAIEEQEEGYPIKKKEILYSNNLNLFPSLCANNLSTLPVEIRESIYKTNSYVNTKKTFFLYEDTTYIKPLAQYGFLKKSGQPWPSSIANLINSNLTPEIRYTSYDSKGKNTSYVTKDGLSVVQLWGYNHQYLIAEIKNASLADITSLGIDMEGIASKDEPSASDWSQLNALRSNLPSAQVTINKYQPLIGISSQTYPNGVELRYIYDSFGRLTEVREIWNSSIRVLKKYEYKFSDES